MSIEHLALGFFCIVILIALVAAIVDYEAKKPKKNIRLPRHTAWDRAAKYYGDTQ